MTKAQIERRKRDVEANRFVDSEICYGGLEYLLGGNTAKECVKSFTAGFDFCAQLAAEERKDLVAILTILKWRT